MNRISKNLIVTTSLLSAMMALLTSCQLNGIRLNSGAGPEDLEVCSTSDGGRLLVTATACRSLLLPGRDGCLEVYNPKADDGFHVLPLTNEYPIPFQPAGICFVESSRDRKWYGKPLIYVCNSAAGAVEVFQLNRESATHLATLGSGLKPNGIAAFPNGRIFVSRMNLIPAFKDAPRPAESDTRPGSPNTISMYEPGPSGGDSGSWRCVIEGINGANGLAPGPDFKSLLFASFHSGKVHSIELSDHDGLPEKRQADTLLSAPFKVDNLKRQLDGSYSVCGPRSTTLTFIHMITRIPCAPGGLVILRDKGDTWSADIKSEWLCGHNLAPSTAVIVGDTIYSGQPFSRGVFRKRIR